MHTLAGEREAAAALAAHERKRADAREAEAAAELARACNDAARLHAELEEQRKGQERAAAQVRCEREAEARRHNLPWVSRITSAIAAVLAALTSNAPSASIDMQHVLKKILPHAL